MRRFILIAGVVPLLLVIGAQVVLVQSGDSVTGEAAVLQEVHRRYMDTWTERDLDAIVEIGTGAAGFGHSTAFPRPVRVADTFRKVVEQFYDMMDVFIVTLHTENYRVVGDTGLAWGHCSYTTKQKDGPQRTVYMRYTHTFAKTEGKWTLVLYHRSLIPTEDTQ